jgi:hypothetical protein
MTHRFGPARNTGAYSYGVGSLGLLGSQLALGGQHGNGIFQLNNGGVTLPGEANDEFTYRIVTAPPLLTLFKWYSDGSLEAEGPVGTHPGTFEGFKNGVSYGQAAFTFLIGVGSLSGAVVADDAAPSGVLSPATVAQLAGTVLADDALASGGVGVAAPAQLGGSVQADDASPSGTVVGYVEPVAVIGSRVVIAGKRRTPLHLAGLDVAEVDDIAFRFATVLLPGEAVLSYACAAEPRVGTDARPAPLRVGAAQKFGPDCIQRVDGSLAEPGVTYLLRCEALLNSGRTAVAQAFLRVVSFAT